MLLSTRFFIGALLATACFIHSVPAAAFSASASFLGEIQHESRVGSGSAADHFMFLRIEPAASISPVDFFAIETAGVFEPVKPFTGNGFFENQGFFIEEIKAVFTHPFGTVFGGKFNPAFGIAWAETIGIWGREFPEEYEITERIGFGTSVSGTLQGGLEAELIVSTFFSDTSFLSQSLINDRGRTRVSDGGAGNTESFLESWSIATNMTYTPLDITVHSAIRVLGRGTGGSADERGIVLGVQKKCGNEELSASPLLELVAIDNYDSTSERRYYVTAGSDMTYRNWLGSLSYTFREGNSTGHHIQMSGGYQFCDYFSLELGYKYARDAGRDNHFVGFLTHVGFEVSS